MRGKRRTGGLGDVCDGFVRAIFVAAIWTVRMAVAPVDTLDALVPGEAFELGGCTFPFCLCRSGQVYVHMSREQTFMYRYIGDQGTDGWL